MKASALALSIVGTVSACGQVSGDAADRPLLDGGRADASEASAARPADASAPEASANTRVRIMAANTSSGNHQSYELAGVHLLQGLAPDVVLIQEFNYPSGGPRALVDASLGKAFSLYVEPETGGIPNGVISRFPIISAGVWTDASVSDRAFVYARIDVPGPIDLWAVSVHLLTTGATQRQTEAAQLVGYVKANVPASDYLVIGGDFNTETTSEAALVTLAEVVTTAGPWPVDQSGNANTSINRDHPHDFVFSRAGVDPRATAVKIGAATFPVGLVFDSRVYVPLADVAPIAATDSGVPGMQHMPVLKDFVFGG